MFDVASSFSPAAGGSIGVHLGEAASDPSDPFELLAGSGTGMFWLWILVPVAVVVFWYGFRQFRRGAGAMRPQGRVLREFKWAGRDDRWRAHIRRLEDRPPTPIAEADEGPVRIEGTIVSASGNLGGRPGRECVWRNRAGARPQSAVGAELVMIADETGRCGAEGVEGAFVIAPTDKHGLHHENVSLYIGDRVEAIGMFTSDRVDDPDNPSETVYGTLTARPELRVRVIERPPFEEEDEADQPAAEAESEASP